MNLWLIFLTGLTTGGLSCLAMQGGLLASVIANQKSEETETSKQEKMWQDWLPVAMFLVSKLVAHTLLGFLLGWLGTAVTLSLTVRLFFQVFTAFFMFATAMNLLDVHPIFRFVVFQPPKFINKIVRSSSKSKAIFAPAILGALTIFVPCGVTQAMEVLAVSSSSPIYGAAIMFAFVLGTVPLFGFLGMAASKLSHSLYQKVNKVAAAILIIMALYGLNGVLVVLNSPITINQVFSPITYFFSDERFEGANGDMVQQQAGVQQIVINVTSNGYSPRYIKVKKDVPVNLKLVSQDAYSCAASFVFREFGIKTFLAANDQQEFNFIPTKAGKFTYTCSMGMYSGTLEVQ